MDITGKTNRLLLTNLQPSYGDKVLTFYNRNKHHFEPWEPDRDPNFYTLHYQRLCLAMEYQLMMQNKLFRLWVFEKDNLNTIIGSVNFYNITYGPYCTCQIGYKLDKDYTGKGYGYESVEHGIQLFLENHTKIHRIEAKIMPSNFSSIRLIERLGFQYEGLAKSSIRINFNWEDHCMYSYIVDNE